MNENKIYATIWAYDAHGSSSMQHNLVIDMDKPEPQNQIINTVKDFEEIIPFSRYSIEISPDDFDDFERLEDIGTEYDISLI
jgi:hypothetical protein